LQKRKTLLTLECHRRSRDTAKTAKKEKLMRTVTCSKITAAQSKFRMHLIRVDTDRFHSEENNINQKNVQQIETESETEEAKNTWISSGGKKAAASKKITLARTDANESSSSSPTLGNNFHRFRSASPTPSRRIRSVSPSESLHHHPRSPARSLSPVLESLNIDRIRDSHEHDEAPQRTPSRPASGGAPRVVSFNEFCALDAEERELQSYFLQLEIYRLLGSSGIPVWKLLQ
jgi:hypothetical protein